MNKESSKDNDQVVITLSNYNSNISHFCSPLSLEKHNAHMSMGIIEECEELVTAKDATNVKEEIGDLLWFSAQYCEKNEIDFTAQIIIAAEASQNWQPSHSAPWSKLLTLTKKELAYTGFVPEYDARVEAINTILTFTIFIMLFHELELDDVLQTNFNKLNTRYKAKAFAAENAINRDLEAERIVLEA